MTRNKYVLLLSLLLTACAPSFEERMTKHGQQCQHEFGFEPGKEGFIRCVELLEDLHQSQQALAALNAPATNNMIYGPSGPWHPNNLGQQHPLFNPQPSYGNLKIKLEPLPKVSFPSTHGVNPIFP